MNQLREGKDDMAGCQQFKSTPINTAQPTVKQN